MPPLTRETPQQIQCYALIPLNPHGTTQLMELHNKYTLTQQISLNQGVSDPYTSIIPHMGDLLILILVRTMGSTDDATCGSLRSVSSAAPITLRKRFA